ncbi:hypothetical protein GQ43DRAFT_471704 [Delitschia confertaspora ATCC 74209]|uniref:Uncharacterized protein n=1 Tax=Delitschia confertaspora ATCC 74209 TaxID=1513339 RepID=A0A9P4MVV4_9PLEO|nr:hypothetical protein GQ43DRAFT_471704 [Delitschia confertaspora ATCC 74209]
MASKFFSWSKGDRRQRTGLFPVDGLHPLDNGIGDTYKECYVIGDSTPRPQRRPRPPNITIPDYNNHSYLFTPGSALHHAALHSVSSASHLLAVVNDMLRSPALAAGACPRSGVHKPLPGRPRSISLPATPDLPELPGSLLLDNQGLPSPRVAGPFATPITMRSVRNGNALNLSVAAPGPSVAKTHIGVPQHKKSFSGSDVQRRSKSKPNLLASPSFSTESKLTACSISTNGGHLSNTESISVGLGEPNVSLQPSPLILVTSTNSPSERVEELKATITAQDNTISTLQSQFGSLRASHEAHITSLLEAHAKEIATLRTYSKVLEEQQSQKTLHHGTGPNTQTMSHISPSAPTSSNHLLLFLDPNEPQSPIREQPLQHTLSASGSTIRSFQTAFEQTTGSPNQTQNSEEMEGLKRRLSAVRKPDTAAREHIRELNQLRENNAALERQIGSLMNKLNQSKKNERELQQRLEEAVQERAESHEKVERLEKAEKALQNTIDHLEGRLQIANIDKVDAQEHLHNLQAHRSPYDPLPAKLQLQTGPGAHASISTVFSSGATSSPLSAKDSQSPTTIGAFVARIGQLEQQIEQKDDRINTLDKQVCQKDDQIKTLEKQNKRLRDNFDQLANEREILNQVHRKLEYNADLQNELLGKTRECNAHVEHIEQLRAAILQREHVIAEKEKAIRMTERQLEHHKLLLQADIRRYAKSAVHSHVQEEPLPELGTLASKDDVDRWIERLQRRLKKEESDSPNELPAPAKDLESQIVDLKKEIDFYVREIIYFKLDIKGYKSDIRKLQRVAATIGNRGDLDSPAPSQAETLSLGFSATSSPMSMGPFPGARPLARPSTPPTSRTTPDFNPSPAGKVTSISHKRFGQQPSPCTPPRKRGVNVTENMDNTDAGISPRSVARLSPERRKPTAPSPGQEQQGDMATNVPLGTPASPKRSNTQRSLSESIIQMYSSSPQTPEWGQIPNDKRTPGSGPSIFGSTRGRSLSLPEPGKGQSTPDRPPRPQYGLFESPGAGQQAQGNIIIPPQKDVMAEAERHSHRCTEALQVQAPQPRKFSFESAIPISLSVPSPQAQRSSASTSKTNSTIDPIVRPTSPKRKDSTASTSSSIPFVIAMGSPHNPALITPTTAIPLTTCSITAKCSLSSVKPGLKLQPGMRAGVGGTMASSPISPTGGASYFSMKRGPLGSASGNSKPQTLGHTKSASTSTPSSIPSPKNNTISTPSSSQLGSGTASGPSGSMSPYPSGHGHSRSVSERSSSIRNAINMNMPSALMKGKGKMRNINKEDMKISNPTPLANSFDFIVNGEKSGAGYGIGEAL